MMRRSYAESYRLMCERIEAMAVEKLERPLSDLEREGICNAGSIMMLEVIDQALEATETAADVAEGLVLAAARFDPQLGLALEGLASRLVATIGRDLSAEERPRLTSIRRIDIAMAMVERIDKAEPAQREGVFRALLAEVDA